MRQWFPASQQSRFWCLEMFDREPGLDNNWRAARFGRIIRDVAVNIVNGN